MTAGRRVTFVTTTLHPRRGMETALLRLAARLAETHHVEIVVVREGGDEDVSGVRISGLGARRAWGGLPALRRRLLSVGPDEVVVLTGLWAAMRAVLVVPSVTRRAVVWEHSLTRRRIHSGPRFRVKAELAARAFQRCARVVAVSGSVAETLREQWGIESVVIPNLLDLPVVSPGRQRVDLRRSTQSDTAARLVAVGAAKPVKNYDMLLRAMAHVPQPWTLQMVGGGPLQTALQELAASLGIGDRVEWPGDVRDVPARMASSDLMVHPASSETFGYVLIEAAEQWLPVVAVDAPVMDRLVPDLVPGVLSKPDEVSFAAAITEALARAGRWDFGRADELRRREFADDRTLAAWEAVLGSVGGQRSDREA